MADARWFDQLLEWLGFTARPTGDRNSEPTSRRRAKAKTGRAVTAAAKPPGARARGQQGTKTMARKVFYSFHYKPDCWRAAQVRGIGAIEGNAPASDNAWETITKGGDSAIERWIDQQMGGRTCVVVLIGSGTANRKWVNYEIIKGWKDGKGVVGIYIHNLKDSAKKQSRKGENPFEHLTFGKGRFSAVVKAYDPPVTISTQVYAHIEANIGKWIEEAITIRSRY